MLEIKPHENAFFRRHFVIRACGIFRRLKRSEASAFVLCNVSELINFRHSDKPRRAAQRRALDNEIVSAQVAKVAVTESDLTLGAHQVLSRARSYAAAVVRIDDIDIDDVVDDRKFPPHRPREVASIDEDFPSALGFVFERFT